MVLLRAAAPRASLCTLLRKGGELEQAAHAAATSPLNLKPQPSDAQRSVGNYAKGHVRFAGLDVTIENPAGSYRRPEWPPMQAHYGYVRGTEGADGDAVDCFLRQGAPLDWSGDAYVVNQPDAAGEFDEHKVMLGFDSQAEAVRCYLSHYPKDWRMGDVVALSLPELKTWLAGDTTEPLAKAGSTHHHLFNTCPYCGTTATCRCTTPKVPTSDPCISCARGHPATVKKEWSAPASATSGIQPYGTKPRKKRISLRAKKP